MSAGACQLADVGDDEFDSSLPRSVSRLSADRGTAPLCLRCNVERCATVHRQQPLCRSCFLSTFITRFRQTLRRRCDVQPATRVLVGWSGGLSSSVLCELLREGKADRGKHRVLLKWDIVHVDCASIRRPTSDEQRSEDEAERSELLSRFHTDSYIVPLSAVFDIPASRAAATAADSPLFFPSGVQHRATRDEQLRALFRSVHPANHARLLSALLAHLLSYCCLRGGYSNLLTGESATHAATAVITAITKGQGRIAAVHTRMQRSLLGAQRAYPLHDTSHTHVAYMFHYQRLSTLSAVGAIHVPNLSHGQQASSSASSSSQSSTATLDSLSRSFIASLDSLFGHSVANVLRTVEKVDRPNMPSTLCCCWCGESLPPTQQFEVALSTQSHSLLRSDGGPNGAGSTSPSAATSTAAATATAASTQSSLHRDCCYDCRRAFALPLLSADPQHCMPDCIRLFDSASYQRRWETQSREAEADSEQAAAATAADATSDTAKQRARHALRHGEARSGVQRPKSGQKQSAERLKAHIQQFLLDESRHEETSASSNSDER